MIPSSKKQRQLIGIACNQLGIDKQVKADMLLARYGKSSTCDISKPEADEFLKELRGKGFRIVRRRPARPSIPRTGDKKLVGMVSKDELDKIEVVSGLIQWKYADGLQLWMKKRMGIDKIRTGNDAYRVIEGLKKMFENGMKKQYGPHWWVDVYTDPGIETYIREHCPMRYRKEMLLARRHADAGGK